MLRRLSMGLLASAISVASLPASAQENGSAEDLGVMSIRLKDVTWINNFASMSTAS